MLLIRRIALYFNFFKFFFKYHGRVNFKGFSVIAAITEGKIIFEKNPSKGKINLQSDFCSNLLGMHQPCILVARDGGVLTIGAGTCMSGTTIYAAERISIGSHVLIGVNTKIVDNDFHPLHADKRFPMKREDIARRPVEIGDDCFIGADCIILKGTRLGKNCVVGAGSVVSGTFPDNVIIAGNPAKIIRENTL